ncbi:MAG: alanine--tRNA ligase-related protein, partial [Waddliaceae bacterium]
FLRTLHRGGNLLSQIVEKAKSQGNQIKGEEAFKLKDTYGLPFEEILLLAKDADLTVDEKKYQVLDEEARERSRQAHQKVSQVAEESLFADFTTTFIGYTDAEAKARIIGLVVDGKPVSEISDGAMGIVILDRTPFYAEMGGQVGDTGVIQGENGFLEVNDCQAPYQGVTAHFGKVEGGLKINDSVFAKVDTKRRQEIENNHTATHLLHWALQKVLGPHANQAGSVVEPTRLRFDFNHHKSLTSSEIKEIESLVNAKIRENLPVKWYEVDYEKVQKDQEIKQFFGEKYGKKVRVIDIQFSKELCGGTHTSMLGRIGFFKITKEGSIAAGIRRMEAVTGFEAEKIVDEQKELLDEIAQVVKAKPGQIKEQIQTLLEENRTLTQKLKLLEKNQAEQLAKTAEKMGSVPVIIKELELSSKNLRPFADEVMKRLKSGVIALAVKEPNKCQVLVMVSDDWIGKGISAKDLIQKISPVIDGGGGGKANSAAAGGKKPENVEEALNMIKESINKCAL